MPIPAFLRRKRPKILPIELTARASEGLGHAFFVSDGSEASEAAFKLARQYFVECGQPQRRYLIARRQNYHGITLDSFAVVGATLDAVPAVPGYVQARARGLRPALCMLANRKA